jgi:hypothetical protein
MSQQNCGHLFNRADEAVAFLSTASRILRNAVDQSPALPEYAQALAAMGNNAIVRTDEDELRTLHLRTFLKAAR